jgi:hypothetical protein
MPLESPGRMVLIVTGSTLRAEELDRPLAYYLKQQVERLVAIRTAGGDDNEPTQVLVVADFRWMSDEPLQQMPTISVGGPGVNALAFRFSDRAVAVKETTSRLRPRDFQTVWFASEGSRRAIASRISGWSGAALPAESRISRTSSGRSDERSRATAQRAMCRPVVFHQRGSGRSPGSSGNSGSFSPRRAALTAMSASPVSRDQLVPSNTPMPTRPIATNAIGGPASQAGMTHSAGDRGSVGIGRRFERRFGGSTDVIRVP